MDATLLALLLGAFGGTVRASLGLFKALSIKMKIYWNYFFLTLVIAAIIGALVGLVFSFEPRLAALAGYAGTDILEGIYKAFKVEKVYVRNK
jgi:fluoride ion exporter CrcB/FEX